MKRRTLLGLGVVGAATVSALGGIAASLHRPGIDAGRLTDAGASVFAAVGGVVLEGLLSDRLPASDPSIQAQIRRLDAVIASLAPHAQAELNQALALLAHPWGRRTIAGLAVGWSEASPTDIAQSLQRMRASPLKLVQQLYHALRDLTNAAYFAEANSWQQIGYPGPRKLEA